MRNVLSRAFAFAASMGLAITVLSLLLLLTVLGTLEQASSSLFEVQRRYFESLFVVHHVGPVPLPLPGVYLLLVVLAVNLLAGGILRIRKDASTWGILLTHAGILLMLGGSAVEYSMSQKGHATVLEGSTVSEFRSYYEWEIAIAERSGEGPVREHVIPGARFASLRPGATAAFSSDALPFDLVVTEFLPNCEPRESAEPGAIDGVALVRLRREMEAEREEAGARVTIVPKDGSARIEGLVWARQGFPMPATVGDRRFGIDLSRRRWTLPFSIRLDDFRQDLHPGTGMAKAFESDVTKFQAGTTQQARISMNAPLRQSGYTLYQSGFIEPADGSSPGARWWSTFSVVRNPADRVPLWSCLVITAGLVLHFTRKLVRHLRASKPPDASADEGRAP
ncbi:MAG: hypothetical protein HMLKMBBP_00416 [Planctomycetes bacterium]|nr:hypothetical protein [Planctomycetota bacterium]